VDVLVFMCVCLLLCGCVGGVGWGVRARDEHQHLAQGIRRGGARRHPMKPTSMQCRL
jgi:hypothetical protein